MIEAHRQNKRKTGMNEQALGDSNELVHTTDYHTNHAAHVAASSVHMQIYDLEVIHYLSTPDAEKKLNNPHSLTAVIYVIKPITSVAPKCHNHRRRTTVCTR